MLIFFLHFGKFTVFYALFFHYLGVFGNVISIKESVPKAIMKDPRLVVVGKTGIIKMKHFTTKVFAIGNFIRFKFWF